MFAILPFFAFRFHARARVPTWATCDELPAPNNSGCGEGWGPTALGLGCGGVPGGAGPACAYPCAIHHHLADLLDETETAAML